MSKKIPSALARVIGARASMLSTSVWGENDNRACSSIKHLACGKEHCTRIYAKQETAERNAQKWIEKHLEKCPKTVEADAAFAVSEEKKA